MRFLTYITSVAVIVSLCSTPSSAQMLNDNANMKILKARASLLHQNRNNVTNEALRNGTGINGVTGKVNCGSVDIANQVSTGGIGQDIDVIITGDIINTGNRCVNAPTNRN